MKPVSSTTLPAIKMIPVNGEASTMFRVPGNKIGWLHTKTNKPGASFDIVFRDSLGRETLRKPNCHTETDQFGEFMGINVHMGEEFEISLENVKGAEEIDLFIN